VEQTQYISHYATLHPFTWHKPDRVQFPNRQLLVVWKEE